MAHENIGGRGKEVVWFGFSRGADVCEARVCVSHCNRCENGLLSTGAGTFVFLTRSGCYKALVGDWGCVVHRSEVADATIENFGRPAWWRAENIRMREICSCIPQENARLLRARN